MTDINQLSRTIEQLRDASPVAKMALADRALAQALGLFQAYDAQLAAQRLAVENLTDKIGSQAVRIEELWRELQELRQQVADFEKVAAHG